MQLFTRLPIYFSLLLFTACGDETPVVEQAVEDNDDGSKTVSVTTKATIPILPADLPIFPTSLTLNGLSSFVMEKKDEYLKSMLSDEVNFFEQASILLAANALIGESTIDSAVSTMEKKLQETTSGILSPGSLSTTVKNQIGALKEVEITSASLKIAVKNTTNKYAAVPSTFRLYFGEKKLVDEKDKEVEIVFGQEKLASEQAAQPEEQQAEAESELHLTASAPLKEATLKPDSSSYSYVSENIPRLVELLNAVLKGESDQEIALGYVNDFRVADVSNGADISAIISKLGGCVFSKALDAAAGSYLSNFAIPDNLCPDVEQLLGWSLTLEGMEIMVEAKTKVLEIPAVPSCSEIATKLDLAKYQKACAYIKK